MGHLIYDGQRYDMEDMFAHGCRTIIRSVNALGRSEWLPFPDWAPDGSRIITYLLIAPGVPVTIQVEDDEGTGGKEFAQLLTSYTKPA